MLVAKSEFYFFSLRVTFGYVRSGKHFFTEIKKQSKIGKLCTKEERVNNPQNKYYKWPIVPSITKNFYNTKKFERIAVLSFESSSVMQF